MIPMLIYLLLKKFRKQGPDTWRLKNILPIPLNLIKALVCILAFLFLSSILINAKGQKLNYKVVRNGDEIGWLKLEKTIDGNFNKMILSSEINFRLIILLSAIVVESACFDNGKLIFSSQYHKTNGKIKVNNQTRHTGNGYEVTRNNTKEKLDVADISFNLLSLYFQEPITQQKVYCDKQECFADIEKTTDGGYKVRFPNGDSNCYYYSNGLCTRIKVEHTFYSAEVILNP